MTAPPSAAACSVFAPAPPRIARPELSSTIASLPIAPCISERGVQRGDRVGDVGADQQRLPAGQRDAGAEARALRCAARRRSRRARGRRRAPSTPAPARGRGAATAWYRAASSPNAGRHVARAGEPRHLDLRVGDGVHREVAGDSTDGGQRRRDPVATREYVRLTAHDEDLPRCIAWSFRPHDGSRHQPDTTRSWTRREAGSVRRRRRLDAEDVPIAAAVGRVTARRSARSSTCPAGTTPSLDGFALRAADADRELPVAFAVLGRRRSAAARARARPCRSRPAACVPGGRGRGGRRRARDARSTDAMRADDRLAPGDGIRRRGGRHRRRRGRRRRRRPADAAWPCRRWRRPGSAPFRCTRRPRAVVLTTGDELVEPGYAAAARPGARLELAAPRRDAGVVRLRRSSTAAGCRTRARRRSGCSPPRSRPTSSSRAAACPSGRATTSSRRSRRSASRSCSGAWRSSRGSPSGPARAPAGAIVLGLPGQPAVGAGRAAPAGPRRSCGRCSAPAEPERRRAAAGGARAAARAGARGRSRPGSAGGRIHPLADASHQIARAAAAGGLVLIEAGDGEHAAGAAGAVRRALPARPASPATRPARLIETRSANTTQRCEAE